MPTAHSPSPRFVLAVLSFGVLVAADDLTVVATMLRAILFDLGLAVPADLDRAAWIVNAYLIAYVAVMPFTGRLSDRVGRQRVFMGALVVFMVGSIWAALAQGWPAFIAARALTALGGGAMVPVSLAIVSDLYPRQERARALGILGAVDTLGWVWGPLYGALLIRFLDWRWQFYLNIPLGLIGLLLAGRALRQLPPPQRAFRLDWPGALALTAGLIALNVALLGSGDVQLAGGFEALTPADRLETGWFYPVAVAALGAFYLWQRRLEQRPDGAPLIDLRLFRRRNFAPALAINFGVGSILIIAMVNVPLLINALEPEPAAAALRSGRLLSLMTGAMALMAWVGGRVVGMAGYRAVTLAGLLACAIGLGWMGATWNPTTPSSIMAWHLAMVGSGLGLVIAPIGAAAINSAPPDQRGITASLVLVLRLMGMSVGLSALTAWGLERFIILRDRLVLPALTDPGYTQALIEGLIGVTTAVLAETFLAAGGIALGVWFIGWFLRPDASAVTDAPTL